MTLYKLYDVLAKPLFISAICGHGKNIYMNSVSQKKMHQLETV